MYEVAIDAAKAIANAYLDRQKAAADAANIAAALRDNNIAIAQFVANIVHKEFVDQQFASAREWLVTLAGSFSSYQVMRNAPGAMENGDQRISLNSQLGNIIDNLQRFVIV